VRDEKKKGEKKKDKRIEILKCVKKWWWWRWSWVLENCVYTTEKEPKKLYLRCEFLAIDFQFFFFTNKVLSTQVDILVQKKISFTQLVYIFLRVKNMRNLKLCIQKKRWRLSKNFVKQIQFSLILKNTVSTEERKYYKNCFFCCFILLFPSVTNELAQSWTIKKNKKKIHIHVTNQCFVSLRDFRYSTLWQIIVIIKTKSKIESKS
jgi:hypothetical protein